MDYKKKNIILLVVAIILLWFIYVFSVSKTLNYKKEYTKLCKEKEQVNNSTIEALQLRKKSSFLDSILKKENISITNSFQQVFLKKINEFKKKGRIELIEFDNPVAIKDNKVNAQLYTIIVKGNFNELLSFLNYIEKQGLGEVKNFKFLKKKNYRTNKEYLQLKIYLKKVVTGI
ncbi:hypothetical protein [Tenacibaculum caenipelagi]|uniref:Uncharacterized protein n=1 Tax=Tenacibaculum caenipelagi TaxID=1325435 RepID=A0A4V3D2P4_9FLAO|nr:hypothetical protein [Tenacibaculum caenipelagi]TDQ21830.1 hypothetical protein DFQ07_2925 [Tenacibaculum caenipelagi]